MVNNIKSNDNGEKVGENNIEKTLEDVNDVKTIVHENEPSRVELYLNKMDPLNMSPMEALSALMELKKLVGK